MTRLGNTKKVVLWRCCLLINMTKWHKVVVLLRENVNISNLSLKYIHNEFKLYKWYEMITSHSKYIHISSRTLEIGVQRSLVLPTQVSNCHLI